VTRWIWQLATLALVASAIVIWHEVLRAKEAAPLAPLEPISPQQLTFNALEVRCYPDFMAVTTSARHGIKVVCAPISRGKQ
jgi:hypothetical protein